MNILSIIGAIVAAAIVALVVYGLIGGQILAVLSRAF